MEEALDRIVQAGDEPINSCRALLARDTDDALDRRDGHRVVEICVLAEPADSGIMLA